LNGRRRENDGGGEFRYDIIEILLRTFVNATMYLTQHNNISSLAPGRALSVKENVLSAFRKYQHYKVVISIVTTQKVPIK
jgi:hypothetical protein